MSILAPWEREWLSEMARVFNDNSWDRKWLRYQIDAIIDRRTNAKRTLQEHRKHKKAMMRAAQIVCRAIKAGKLPSPKDLRCVDCKRRLATQYEHRDYAKPLEVEPVCQSCNIKRGPAILSRAVPTRKSRAA